MLKIQIIIGSTRPGRVSEKVAKWLNEHLTARTDAEFELVDLKDWPLPFYDVVGTVKGIQGNYDLELARKWAEKIGQADGYIFVSPEYNHGYSAVLKNAIDFVYDEWIKKPAAFVSYGGAAAGSRAVEQLRQVVVELQMVSIREQILIPMAWSAFDDQGQLKEVENLKASADRMVDQLVWWGKALKNARES